LSKLKQFFTPQAEEQAPVKSASPQSSVYVEPPQLPEMGVNFRRQKRGNAQSGGAYVVVKTSGGNVQYSTYTTFHQWRIVKEALQSMMSFSKSYGIGNGYQLAVAYKLRLAELEASARRFEPPVAAAGAAAVAAAAGNVLVEALRPLNLSNPAIPEEIRDEIEKRYGSFEDLKRKLQNDSDFRTLDVAAKAAAVDTRIGEMHATVETNPILKKKYESYLASTPTTDVLISKTDYLNALLEDYGSPDLYQNGFDIRMTKWWRSFLEDPLHTQPLYDIPVEILEPIDPSTPEGEEFMKLYFDKDYTIKYGKNAILNRISNIQSNDRSIEGLFAAIGTKEDQTVVYERQHIVRYAETIEALLEDIYKYVSIMDMFEVTNLETKIAVDVLAALRKFKVIPPAPAAAAAKTYRVAHLKAAFEALRPTLAPLYAFNHTLHTLGCSTAGGARRKTRKAIRKVRPTRKVAH
jgi:hypothetical protein